MNDREAALAEMWELARVGSLHNALCDHRGRMSHLTGYMRALQEVGAAIGSLPADADQKIVSSTVATFLAQALAEAKSELDLLNNEIDAAVDELDLVPLTQNT